MIVTHFGWRIPLLSSFANASSLERAKGPDQTLIAWLDIVLLVMLAALVPAVRLWIRRLAGGWRGRRAERAAGHEQLRANSSRLVGRGRQVEAAALRGRQMNEAGPGRR